MSAVTSQVLRIALPKGRLMERTVAWFGRAGLLDPASVDAGRRLVVPLPSLAAPLGMPVELLLLKNADVPTYVEHGVAQVGVCGTDVLDESGSDVLRPLTLPFGSCRIAIAGPRGVRIDDLSGRDQLRIATKYTRTARAWFEARGWPVELIELGGSVELAAVLGLSDAIVDLVETGRTLVENDLEVLEVIGHTRVLLVANRALPAAHARAVQRLIDALQHTPAPGA